MSDSVTKIKVIIRVAPPQVSASFADLHGNPNSSAETLITRKKSFIIDDATVLTANSLSGKKKSFIDEPLTPSNSLSSKKKSFIEESPTTTNNNIVVFRRDEHVVRTVNPKENIRSKEKEYTYDQVFDASANQNEIYRAVSPIVLQAFEGHCVNIFAHGATAAGKTYTMHGTNASPGIVPQALTEIFNEMDAMQKKDPNINFHVEMSFTELYNNNFRNLITAKAKKSMSAKVSSNLAHHESIGTSLDDLDHDNVTALASTAAAEISAEVINSNGVESAAPTEATSALSGVDFPPRSPSPAAAPSMPTPPTSASSYNQYGDGESKIDIHESDLLGVFLSGENVRVSLSLLEEALFLFHKGEKLRTSRPFMKTSSVSAPSSPAEAINVNSYSASRSHSIFTLYLEVRNSSNQLRLGKINFIDLAGTERQDNNRGHLQGAEMAEIHNINISLAALGDVLFAIAEQSKMKIAAKKKVTYGAIPYRNSKLTHYMKESFGGNALTVMIANLHSTSDFYPITTTTLNYASWAAQTHCTVVANVVDMNAPWLHQMDDPESIELRRQMTNRSKALSELQQKALDQILMVPVVPDFVIDDEEGVAEEKADHVEEEELDVDDPTALLLPSCSRCMDLLALVKRLETQLREARAELALNEGVQRRLVRQLLEAQTKIDSNENSSLDEKEKQKGDVQRVSKVLEAQQKNQDAEKRIRELENALTRLLEDAERHRSSSPPHVMGDNSNKSDLADENDATSSTPLIPPNGSNNTNTAMGSQYGSLNEVDPSSQEKPKKTFLQKYCCGCYN